MVSWRSRPQTQGHAAASSSSLLGTFVLLFVAFPTITQAATLRDLIIGNENLSKFRTACAQLGLLELELDDVSTQYTVFAPTDTAIDSNPFFSLYMQGVDEDPPRWHEHLEGSVRNHLVLNTALTKDVIFDGSKFQLYSMQDALELQVSSSHIQGAQIESADLQADNGVLHVINRVLEPNFYQHSLEQLEEQAELGDDWLGRVSMKTIVEFNDARGMYSHVIPEGQTHVACRIRALNKIGLDYLPKTLNRSPGIKFGEFLNGTNKDETKFNLIEYSLPHHNFYRRDLPRGHEEWIMSPNNCSHMLVTKSPAGTLCFNNGCVVSTPAPREWLANNGVGYIVDKCVVCSGVAMLLEYAAWYTDRPNLDDAAQFFETSEWNLRNLSMSVGDGGPVTLLAARDEAFDIFNAEDVSRISTDKWKKHQWDFLLHNMLQGEYTEQDFITLWEENLGKPYKLTMLSGENVTFDYDDQRKVVMIDGGDIIKSNLKGLDG